MLISIENNLDRQPTTLYSFFSTNASAGGTAIPVKNINSFSAQYAVQIGKTGEEQSEIALINTPSGTILPLNSGSLRFDHPQDTPVFNIHYDSIILSRSTTGTAGTASAYATVSITPDSLYTEYNDISGVSTYAYRSQYFNSLNGDVSSLSDWFTTSGVSYYSLIKMRERVKSALYNATYIKSDEVLNDWINEWLEIMTNSAIKVNQAYSVGTSLYSFGTAGLGTITDSNFKQPLKMEVTWDGNNYAVSQEIPLNRYSSTDIFSAIYPRHYWQGDTIFGILPNGQAGTVRATYAIRNTPLVNDTDELPLSLRSYTVSCINYALYRAYANDTKPELADQYYQKFLQSKGDFINEVTPRDQTGPKIIDLVEGISGMNEGVLIGSDWLW